MNLTAIVAHDPSRLIGAGNELPWHLPEDLAFFKKTTSGHPILMGRKTYQSIGRPLPKRQNIVLTRDQSWQAEGVTVIHNPAELATTPLTHPGPVYIIGGAEIYRHFLPLLDELLVTHVKKAYAGDTYFPDYGAFFEASATLADTEDFRIVQYRRTRGLDS